MQKIELTTGSTAKGAQLLIDGNPVHFSALNIDLCVGEANRIVITAYVKNFAFNGEGNVEFNGVCVGMENELALLKQLKEKYDK